jgi:hypothetical protein
MYATAALLVLECVSAWLGHCNIQHTARYTELAPDRFRSGMVSIVAPAAGNLVGAEASRTVAVGNRSGVGCSAGSRPMR